MQVLNQVPNLSESHASREQSLGAIKKVVIVGLGLIGGSLGLAMKRKMPDLLVWGIDQRPETAEEAVRLGAVDAAGTLRQLEEALCDAQLVFLAVPVPDMPRLCEQLSPYLSAGMTVTDTGSTKAKLVKYMETHLPDGVSFLGGHPMAGSEKTGIRQAHGELLENAVYLLTPTEKTTMETVQVVGSFLEKLGARIRLLSPAEHDRKVAAISHLPLLLAGALVNTVGKLEEQEGGFFALAAGGFRDTTRIAGSPSGLWRDILLQNKETLLVLLGEFRQVLAEYETALAGNDEVALAEILERSRRWREQVPVGLKGILPQVFELTVTVPDEPGVLAELTGVLKEKRINISDIEIRPVREGIEGTVRLGFESKEACDEAVRVLTGKGYAVRYFLP